MVRTVEKREGHMEPFDIEKVQAAVTKACSDAGQEDVSAVVKAISRHLAAGENTVATVEQIQDEVVASLLQNGYDSVAQSYQQYREYRTARRNAGWQMDELQTAIWEKKYQHDGESFDRWLQRVSGGDVKIAKLIQEKRFIFAGRILSHRGLQHVGQKVTFSNCYVEPAPEDNLESIFDRAKDLARTYSYGGGVGMDISKLRPAGAVVHNSARVTSGAVSFMQLYDMTTGLIGQNGRRGALMLSIADSHPDIEQFIDIKTQDSSITKANISIRVTDDFMTAVLQDKDWLLHWEGEDGTVIERTVNARALFEKNAQNNWDWAEAGMLYWDKICKWHLMSEHPEHQFAGVNPCAEEPLMAYGSCLLGSLNLSEFVVHPFTNRAYFDSSKFIDAVKTAVTGLNDVLDEGMLLHPLQGQRDNARDWRQIGLGIMGLADMFIRMGVRYGSQQSLDISHKIAHTMLNAAVVQSSLLAAESEPFPQYDWDTLNKSEFFTANIHPTIKALVQQNGLRNSQIMTIAPTGTISTMWGISGGIEPIFARSYTRKTESLHGEDRVYTVYTPICQQYMDATGTAAEDTDLLVAADELLWSDRVQMQSIWQQYIDASISSTVNLPQDATPADVGNLFIAAWASGLKGITIFRAGCKRAPILTTSTTTAPAAEQPTADNGYSTDTKYSQCEECGKPIEIVEGACVRCLNCGHSPCS